MRSAKSRFQTSLLVVGLCTSAAVGFVVSRPGANASGVAAHDFIGAERCRSCHQAEFDVWAKGPHAGALESLGEHERKDARCQQCHTMVPGDVDPALGAIQCEACHGPGKWYSKDYIMRDSELRSMLYLAVPDEKTCTRCHTDSSPSIQAWDYKTKLEKIRHWPLTESAR